MFHISVVPARIFLEQNGEGKKGGNTGKRALLTLFKN